MLLRQIYSGHTCHLVKYLSEWPLVEISLFVREVMLCLPCVLTRSECHALNLDKAYYCTHSLGSLQQAHNVELVQELNTVSHVEVMRAVQFFAEVIVHLQIGAEAFLEAQGPDVLLALIAATPPGWDFFFVAKSDGEEPLWDKAIDVLTQYPGTSQHRLLSAIKRSKVAPTCFAGWKFYSAQTARHGQAENRLIEVIEASLAWDYAHI